MAVVVPGTARRVKKVCVGGMPCSRLPEDCLLAAPESCLGWRCCSSWSLDAREQSAEYISVLRHFGAISRCSLSRGCMPSVWVQFWVTLCNCVKRQGARRTSAPGIRQIAATACCTCHARGESAPGTCCLKYLSKSFASLLVPSVLQGL